MVIEEMIEMKIRRGIRRSGELEEVDRGGPWL